MLRLRGIWTSVIISSVLLGLVHFLLEVAVFGAAVAALDLAGRPSLAWTLGIVFVINRLLMYAWGQ